MRAANRECVHDYAVYDETQKVGVGALEEREVEGEVFLEGRVESHCEFSF